MTVEEITIPTTKEKFFLEYLTLKKPVLDAILTKVNRKRTTLSDIPLKIYAQLLYYNDINKDLSDSERWSVVFGKHTKEIICISLNLKENHLNNYFSSLRKMRILNGKTINKPFIVYSAETQLLSFKFKINGQNE